MTPSPRAPCAGSVVVVALLLSAASSPAEVQTKAEDSRAEARRLYQLGNKFFEERSYSEAVAKFKEALALWDHPAIRFNVAECYVSLVQPLDAYENLLVALSHGPDLFDSPQHFERGVVLKNRLLAQLGRLELAAPVPGTEITVDGRAVKLDGTTTAQVILPGAHQIVASKAGYLTHSETTVLSPGESKRLVVTLERVRVFKKQRRWTRGLPWQVMGAGAAVALLAVPLNELSRSNFDEYDNKIAALCGIPDGCVRDNIPDGTLALRRRGDTEKTAALAAVSVGSAALVVGTIMLMLNQPRAVEVLPGSAPRVTPKIASDAASLMIGWSF